MSVGVVGRYGDVPCLKLRTRYEAIAWKKILVRFTVQWNQNILKATIMMILFSKMPSEPCLMEANRIEFVMNKIKSLDK